MTLNKFVLCCFFQTFGVYSYVPHFMGSAIFFNVICLPELQVMSFSLTHSLTRKLRMACCGKLRERSVGLLIYFICLAKLHLVTF